MRGCGRSGARAGFAAAAALGTALGAGLVASPAAARDIKVCLIAGKSGPLEAYAKQTEAGFMMGLEYLTRGTMKVGDEVTDARHADGPQHNQPAHEHEHGDDGARTLDPLRDGCCRRHGRPPRPASCFTTHRTPWLRGERCGEACRSSPFPPPRTNQS